MTLKQLWQKLSARGCEASYNTICRYAQEWRTQQVQGVSKTFVPLAFGPGEAYQFDWSHEHVRLGKTLGQGSGHAFAVVLPSDEFH